MQITLIVLLGILQTILLSDCVDVTKHTQILLAVLLWGGTVFITILFDKKMEEP